VTRVLLAAALLAGACDFDLERMIDQPRFTSYEACEACPEGTIMMRPPPGAVARGADPAGLTADGAAPDGRAGGVWVADIPIPVDRALVSRGRGRFDIFCAACHGRLGNGVSQVAENMVLREPPSLLAPPVSGYPAGRVYAAITAGYGLMRSYASELSPVDRWAVVAYVEALRLSQQVELSRLPGPLRVEASPWLR
jgi:mono/diheme cytochrome c family protein